MIEKVSFSDELSFFALNPPYNNPDEEILIQNQAPSDLNF
jgi:hypothetical protein